MNVRSGFAVCLVALSPAGSLFAQLAETVVLRDGHLFDGVGDRAVPNMDLFGRGRVAERTAYPVPFRANGVTSTFPAGEMNLVEVRWVMKVGRIYDPNRLLASVEGTIGPRNADEELDWMPMGRAASRQRDR